MFVLSWYLKYTFILPYECEKYKYDVCGGKFVIGLRATYKDDPLPPPLSMMTFLRQKVVTIQTKSD